MLARAIFQTEDEAERLPRLVDRGTLVVDQAVREADALHGVEVEVGLERRRLLRPRDPEAVRGRERRLQRGEAPLQLPARGREEDEHLDIGLRAELLPERRP